MKILILGGGLAGLSCSYHLGHRNCHIIERKPYLGGHAATHYRDGAFWDEGPHVSFTKHAYVKHLLSWSANGPILDYPTDVGNHFQGHWIPHPAQSHLSAVPEPLARHCLDDFLHAQRSSDTEEEPKNYQQWLDQAFGLTFSRTFPHAYTRKYWTCEPADLATDWVGKRVFKPDLATVTSGYEGNPKANTHYISSVRYPAHGGFASFFQGLSSGAQVIHDEVVSVDLKAKVVWLSSGTSCAYEVLISTIPLDRLIGLIPDVPEDIKEAVATLRCSSLLLVNIHGTQARQNPYHWLYVYDEDKYSTRITQTHLLAPANTPDGVAGVQVEVYASPYKPFRATYEEIAERVVEEVRQMQLIDQVHSMHFNFIPYANVIFDHHRREAQDAIFSFLAGFGLERERDDLEPITEWEKQEPYEAIPGLMLAGRFAQWKYFWSDDCILRGRQLSLVHLKE